MVKANESDKASMEAEAISDTMGNFLDTDLGPE